MMIFSSNKEETPVDAFKHAQRLCSELSNKHLNIEDLKTIDKAMEEARKGALSPEAGGTAPGSAYMTLLFKLRKMRERVVSVDEYTRKEEGRDGKESYTPASPKLS